MASRFVSLEAASHRAPHIRTRSDHLFLGGVFERRPNRSITSESENCAESCALALINHGRYLHAWYNAMATLSQTTWCIEIAAEHTGAALMGDAIEDEDDLVADPSLTLQGLLHVTSRRPLRQQAEAARNAVTHKIFARVLAWQDRQKNRKPQKPTSEWLNLVRLVLAHKALTEAGVTWEIAADRLCAQPEVKHLLPAKPDTSESGYIIRLRKDFGAGRATKIPIARDAYEDGCKIIEQYKGDSDGLYELAARALAAIGR